MKTEIRLTGTDELKKLLLNSVQTDRFKRAVSYHTAEMVKGAHRRAIFRGHFQGKKWIPATGATRATIKMRIEDQGMTGVLWVEADYAPYLEFGTRYMDAQPFLGPAFNLEAKALKDTLARALKKA